MRALLGASEADYYRQPLEKPELPPEGMILLTRLPMTQTLKITYPSGETRFFNLIVDQTTHLIRAGIPEDKLQAALDRVWNMVFVYVKTPNYEASLPIA